MGKVEVNAKNIYRGPVLIRMRCHWAYRILFLTLPFEIKDSKDEMSQKMATSFYPRKEMLNKPTEVGR